MSSLSHRHHHSQKKIQQTKKNNNDGNKTKDEFQPARAEPAVEAK
jgi:hypothetical protein